MAERKSSTERRGGTASRRLAEIGDPEALEMQKLVNEAVDVARRDRIDAELRIAEAKRYRADAKKSEKQMDEMVRAVHTIAASFVPSRAPVFSEYESIDVYIRAAELESSLRAEGAIGNWLADSVARVVGTHRNNLDGIRASELDELHAVRRARESRARLDLMVKQASLLVQFRDPQVLKRPAKGTGGKAGAARAKPAKPTPADAETAKTTS